MTSRNPITLLPFESYFSLREVEDYIREAFVREFGDEMIRRVRAGKYPDEIGVRVVVAQKDLPKMSKLADEIVRQFEEKGIEVGIGISTS